MSRKLLPLRSWRCSFLVSSAKPWTVSPASQVRIGALRRIFGIGGFPHSSLCRSAVPTGVSEKQGAAGPLPVAPPMQRGDSVKLRTATPSLALALALSSLLAAVSLRAQEPANDPSLWPEAERSFF